MTIGELTAEAKRLAEQDATELRDHFDREQAEFERTAAAWEAFVVECAGAVVEVIESWRLGPDGKPVEHRVELRRDP